MRISNPIQERCLPTVTPFGAAARVNGVGVKSSKHTLARPLDCRIARLGSYQDTPRDVPFAAAQRMLPRLPRWHAKHADDKQSREYIEENERYRYQAIE